MAAEFAVFAPVENNFAAVQFFADYHMDYTHMMPDKEFADYIPVPDKLRSCSFSSTSSKTSSIA